MILVHMLKLLSDKLAMLVGMNGASSSHFLLKIEGMVYLRKINMFGAYVLVLALVRRLNVVIASMQSK